MCLVEHELGLQHLKRRPYVPHAAAVSPQENDGQRLHSGGRHADVLVLTEEGGRRMQVATPRGLQALRPHRGTVRRAHWQGGRPALEGLRRRGMGLKTRARAGRRRRGLARGRRRRVRGCATPQGLPREETGQAPATELDAPLRKVSPLDVGSLASGHARGVPATLRRGPSAALSAAVEQIVVQAPELVALQAALLEAIALAPT
mmetsp:Transcript_97806/g.276672  ORF Transcript_97806/g.276672 Transcript_97806/m.276672 type:complete len:204 (-) Transcript_97806:181-792(-)